MDEYINAVSTSEEMNQNIEMNFIVILYELKRMQKSIVVSIFSRFDWQCPYQFRSSAIAETITGFSVGTRR